MRNAIRSVLVCTLLLAGCGGAGALLPTGSSRSAAETCEYCGCVCTPGVFAITCDPDDPANNCCKNDCNANGSCSCTHVGSSDECTNGVCAVIQTDGGSVLGCVHPDCTTDDDCPDNQLCVVGSEPQYNQCGCAGEQTVASDGSCCPPLSDGSACCAPGVAFGSICECPANMVSTAEGEGCSCYDAANAQYDDSSGDCTCASDSEMMNPTTHACECLPGLTPSYDTDGYLYCL